MTLKLVKKGLTEAKEECPNCYSHIYVFKDENGKIKKLNGATQGERTGKIICDNCNSELKAE